MWKRKTASKRFASAPLISIRIMHTHTKVFLPKATRVKCSGRIETWGSLGKDVTRLNIPFQSVCSHAERWHRCRVEIITEARVVLTRAQRRLPRPRGSQSWAADDGEQQGWRDEEKAKNGVVAVGSWAHLTRSRDFQSFVRFHPSSFYFHVLLRTETG